MIDHMAKTEPYVGQSVHHYSRARYDANFDGPFAAIVTAVTAAVVCLSVSRPGQSPSALTSVPFIHEGEEIPDGCKSYAAFIGEPAGQEATEDPEEDPAAAETAGAGSAPPQ